MTLFLLETDNQQISVINVLGPWLFETAELSEYVNLSHKVRSGSTQINAWCNRKFDEGKAVAYSALCRLICRHTDEFIPFELLAHYYELIKKVKTINTTIVL